MEQRPNLEPLMPETGVTQGHLDKPLYRYVHINHGDEDLSRCIQKNDARAIKVIFHRAGKLREHADGGVQHTYGIHWTHDLEAIRMWAAEDEHGYGENGIILICNHPGFEHIMDWDNAQDRQIMERAIGSYDYKDSVTAEVPIRPDADIQITGIMSVDSLGDLQEFSVQDSHVIYIGPRNTDHSQAGIDL